MRFICASEKMKHFFLFMTLLALGANGCKKMPNDGYPFYLRINEVELYTQPSQGANTHGITDVWIEANSTNLGGSQFPIEMPILEEGNVRMTFQAGIKANGFTGARIVYPFYSPDTVTLKGVKRLDKIIYKPKFTYKPSTKFQFLEDFEFGNQFSYTLDKVNDGNVAYGNWCGRLSVNSSQSAKETQSTSTLVLKGGTESWVEFDYKADASFEVGIYAGAARLSKIILFPKQTWNKFYMNVSNEIGSYGGEQFNIFFKVSLPENGTSANVWIDNVKLLTF